MIILLYLSFWWDISSNMSYPTLTCRVLNLIANFLYLVFLSLWLFFSWSKHVAQLCCSFKILFFSILKLYLTAAMVVSTMSTYCFSIAILISKYFLKPLVISFASYWTNSEVVAIVLARFWNICLTSSSLYCNISNLVVNRFSKFEYP